MTPRQATAWARLAQARRKEENADFLIFSTLAARGEGEAIKGEIRNLTRGF